MAEVIGARLQRFNTAGSLGVVTDTIYRECFWPALDTPTALFAPGSSGIQVQGPPTPRNVIFPPDTVYLPMARSGIPTNPDAVFLKEPRTQRLDELAADPKAANILPFNDTHVMVLLSKADAVAITEGGKTRDQVLAAEIVKAEAASERP